MADPSELCPTCHSRISQSGSRVKDADEPGVPKWSNDPVLTPDTDPLNGPSYRGTQFISEKDILELQEDRIARESELGIGPPTEFSDIAIVPTLGLEAHLVELRISTERILEAVGSSLEEYFSLDEDGIEQDPGPNDTAKSEWTDVVRGVGFQTLGLNQSILTPDTTQFYASEALLVDVPGIPEHTYIRGIHIEDLRHPIPSGAWVEVFKPAETTTLSSVADDDTSYGINPSCPAVISTQIIRTVNIRNDTIIVGDTFDSYDLDTNVRAQKYYHCQQGTLDEIKGPSNGRAEIEVSASDLYSGLAHKLELRGEAEFLKDNFSGGPSMFLSSRAEFGVAVTGISDPLASFEERMDYFREHATAQPRKVTANTRLEIFFEYDLESQQISADIPGLSPSIPYTFLSSMSNGDLKIPSATRYEYQAVFNIDVIPTINLDNPVFSLYVVMSLALLDTSDTTLSVPNDYVRQIVTSASPITNVDFTTIAEENDPFFNKQVISVPFTDFITDFDLNERYIFKLNLVAALRPEASAVLVSPPSVYNVVHTANLTFNGYRVRTVAA